MGLRDWLPLDYWKESLKHALATGGQILCFWAAYKLGRLFLPEGIFRDTIEVVEEVLTVVLITGLALELGIETYKRIKGHFNGKAPLLLLV